MLHGSIPNGIVVVGIIKKILIICPLLHHSLQNSFFCHGSTHVCACAFTRPRDFSLKCFEVSVTIAVGGMKINVGLLFKLRKYIQEECMVGLCSIEQSGALTHDHFQLLVKGKFSSLPVLNKKIKVCFN